MSLSETAGKIISRVKDSSLMTKAGFGAEIYFAWDSYSDARARGDGFIPALGQAAIDFALPEVIGPWKYAGYHLVASAGGLALDTYEDLSQSVRQMNREGRNQTPFRNASFRDNERLEKMRQSSLKLAQEAIYGNFTQRQAGMQHSKRMRQEMNQTMLGNEASYL